MRRSLILAALVVALAGCGGDEASTVGADSAAMVAPAEAVLYASVNTDLDSDQWEQLRALLDKFPGRQKLVDAITEGLQEQGLTVDDLRAAAGPTLELVALEVGDESGLVGLAQPKDEAKFRALFEESDEPVVFREIEGWTAFAQSHVALDRFEQARGDSSLADDDTFGELMGELPDEALAKLWFDGSAITGAGAVAGEFGGTLPQLGRLQPDAGSVALEAADEGVRLLVHIRNDDPGIEAREFGELAEQVPADAFAFVTAHGHDGELELTEALRGLPGAGQGLGEAERMLGVTLEEVATLFNKEIVLWARPGVLIPEVTLALEVEDEAEARATVDRIARSASSLGQFQSSPRQVGDVEATQVDLGDFAILYAAFDGKLVVTTQTSGIEALTGDVDRLVDADKYEESLEAAGVADDENVVLWVDLQQAFALAETVATLADEPIPPEVRENIAPLQSVVLSAKPSFEDGSMRLFVHVR